MTGQNIQQQKQYKILLVGDHCIDIYQYGSVDRISPEAPVPIFKFSHQEEKQGMAGNVYNNLASLGIDIFYAHDSLVSKRTRLIDLKSNQQVLRIDHDIVSKPIIIGFHENMDNYDAVVISDYNKGFITYEYVEWVRQKFKGPVFIDTKKTDLARFAGCFVKINESENQKKISNTDDLIITLGSKGACYQGEIYPVDKVEVTDITGAGDTFLSALVYSYLNNQDIKEAIKFANRASSITVQHTGVYAPTLEEIL